MPTTEMSSGTRRPCPRRTCTAPMAISSEAAKMAVGSSPEARSCRHAVETSVGGEVAGHLPGRFDLQPGGFHGPPVALEAIARGRELEAGVLGVGRAAEVGDAFVAEVDQVLYGGRGRVDVVDANTRPVGHETAYDHCGGADAGQRRHLRGGRSQRQHHHGVDPLAHQVGGEHPVPCGRVAGDVVEEHVIALAPQQLLRSVDDRAEEPPRHVGYDDPDGPGLPTGQARGVRRRDVLHPRSGGQHALAGSPRTHVATHGGRVRRSRSRPRPRAPRP